MKKYLTALLCAMLAVVFGLGFAACSDGEKESISVYMPDGAPALAAAYLMAGETSFDREVNYEVVDPSLISAYVTGENPKADVCILPVNLASKLLGLGEKYKMLGTVTHGNLFLLKSEGENVTRKNLSSLKGKTVGIINIAAVPGLTFKIILKDNGLEYNEIGNCGEVDAEKVNLKAVTAEALTGCDYYVVPEPAASTKVNNTALSFAGSLQELYGESGGYPQAVLVAKSSLIEKASGFIEKFVAAVTENSSWLLKDETMPEAIISAIEGRLTQGMSPTFTAANLTKGVIENCAISFVKSSLCKAEVNSFISKLISVNPSAASTVSDAFYYTK